MRVKNEGAKAVQGKVVMLPLPDVPLRQTEHSRAMDWSFCAGRGCAIPGLVAASGLHALIDFEASPNQL
jgi:hypothetical protein